MPQRPRSSRAPCDLCRSGWVYRFQLDGQVVAARFHHPLMAYEWRVANRFQHQIGTEASDIVGTVTTDLSTALRFTMQMDTELPTVGVRGSPALQLQHARAIQMDAAQRPVCRRSWIRIAGSFAFAQLRTSLNARRTFRSSNAEPIVEVNTSPDACQAPPAFSCSRLWRVRCRFSAVTATSGKGTVRRLLSLFGSTNWSFPSTRWRACRTVRVRWSKSTSFQRRPSVSPKPQADGNGNRKHSSE
jgi:hypothetical protein